MNMFAMFDEVPSMTLQDIKEKKRYGRTHAQRENSIPTTNKVCGGGIIIDKQFIWVNRQLKSSKKQ